MDLTQLGEVIINFNSQTNQQELGRHEVHDYQNDRIVKMMAKFANELIDLQNDFGGNENKDLTSMRCHLFDKYQKMVADGVEGTTDVTAANFDQVHVALIGNPLKGNKDG
jgi:hypothetical protein